MRLDTVNTRALSLSANSSTTSMKAAVLQGPQGPQGLPGVGSAAWTAATAVTTGTTRQAPDGSWIKSTASRTTRATFDATEQTFWTVIEATPGTLAASALTATIGAIAPLRTDLAIGALEIGGRADAPLHNPGYTQTTLIAGADPTALSAWNANPSLAWWLGSWWLTYDNNRSGGLVELATGQHIALRKSTNATAWTDGGEPFTDGTLCNNPRTGDGHIQSNLVTAGDTHPLLCMWNVSGSSGFVSKLTTATGKWTNYRLEWNGTAPSLNANVQAGDPPASGCTLNLSLDGITDWGIFFPSNPVVLKDGTIAAPVAFHSNTASPDAVANDSTFQKQAKFVAVLYFDASGNPTYLSERVPLTSDVPGYGAWEPYLVEAMDGTLRMFIRNLKTSGATDAGVLAVSESRNRRSWSPARATEVLTASERANAVRVSDSRWIAAAMDYPAGLPGNQFQGRFNPVLFVSRSGQDDFVPGPSVGDTNTNAIYPQVIAKDGVAYVVWYRQRDNRNDLMLTTITLPADEKARVYLRRYHEISGKGPAVVGSTLRFTGIERATASTAPLVHANHTWAAWLTPRSTQGIIADARANTAGSVLHMLGLSLNSLTVYHGVTLTPGSPLFIAGQVDAPNRLINVWASSNGGALTQVSSFVRALTFTTNPPDGETITINGVTYTFKTTATLSTHVPLYTTAVDTAGSLSTVLARNTMVAGTYGAGELICARVDGADFTVTPGASVTVNATIPDTLMAASQTPRVGQRRANTSLMPLDADVYEVKAWDAVLSAANIKSVYNDFATTLGFSALSGASAPASPAITLTTASTTGTFPDIADNPQGKASASGSIVTMNGEASAAVELPYPGSAVSFVAQLGALPSSTDKYVLATFGTAAHPKRLYIEGAAPTSLKLDGTVVMTVPDPTRPFAVEVAVTPNSVVIGQATVQQRTSPGYPRMFLGQAFAEGKLAYSKTTMFDTSKLSVAEYRERPLDPTLFVSTNPDVLTVGEESINRDLVGNNNFTATSGTLFLRYFTARKSETITQFRMGTRSTGAAATPTLVRMGVYSVDASGNLTLVAATASDTALFNAANTRFVKALSSSWAKSQGQRYAIGVLVVTSATAPTLSGVSGMTGGDMADAPRLTSAVTGLTDIPSTVASGSVSSSQVSPYVAMLP